MYITKDKSKIDRNTVIQYLMEESYWARDRSPEKIFQTIENSLCYSLIHDDRFIGFCRVITDYTTFSYLCDVFILPEFQNRKLGSYLIETVLLDEEIKDTKFMLFTQTAHRFYEKFGFRQDRERMERVMFK